MSIDVKAFEDFIKKAAQKKYGKKKNTQASV
jgi:hypothetical protein